MRVIPLPQGIDASSIFYERKRSTLFVSDRATARILRFDSSGRLFGRFGGIGTQQATFLDPRIIGATASGSLLIFDTGNRETSSGKYRTAAPRLVVCQADGRFIGGLPINEAGATELLKIGQTIHGGYSLFAASESGALFAVHTDVMPVSPWGTQTRNTLCRWEERGWCWKSLFPIQPPDRGSTWRHLAIAPNGKSVILVTDTGRVYLVDLSGKPVTYRDQRGAAIGVVRNAKNGNMVGVCMDDAGGMVVLESESDTFELGPRPETHGKNGMTVYPTLSDRKGIWQDLDDRPRGLSWGEKDGFYVLLPHKIVHFTSIRNSDSKS